MVLGVGERLGVKYTASFLKRTLRAVRALGRNDRRLRVGGLLVGVGSVEGHRGMLDTAGVTESNVLKMARRVAKPKLLYLSLVVPAMNVSQAVGV